MTEDLTKESNKIVTVQDRGTGKLFEISEKLSVTLIGLKCYKKDNFSQGQPICLMIIFNTESVVKHVVIFSFFRIKF